MLLEQAADTCAGRNLCFCTAAGKTLRTVFKICAEIGGFRIAEGSWNLDGLLDKI